MKTFTDNKGRSWAIDVNVTSIKRVRDLAKVNLLEAMDGTLLQRLSADPILLCDVIYALCRPEAECRSVSDAEFGEALGGQSIDDATDALLEVLTGFFRSAQRTILTKALGKMRHLEQKAVALMEAKLDDPQLEKRLDDLLNAPSSLSGDAPESSGSIPAR